MKEPMLDDEQLAALLDNRLDARARGEALALLAESDDDYLVFAVAAAILRQREEAAGMVSTPAEDGAAALVAEQPATAAETEARPDISPAPGTVPEEPAMEVEKPETPVIVLRRRPVWSRPAVWGALAATLAGLALIPAIRARSADPFDPARLAVRASSGLPPGWTDQSRPWGTSRGGQSGTADPQTSARIGALLVDLELAVRSRDTAATSDVALKVQSLLENVRGSGIVAQTYDRIAQGAGQQPERLEALLKDGREQLPDYLEKPYFEAGVWAEAAYLASQGPNPNPAFFRSREGRVGLDRLRGMDSLPANARATVERVHAALQADTRDWNVIREDLRTLLDILGR